MAAVSSPSLQQQMAEVEEAARGRCPVLVQAAWMGRHDVLAHLLRTASGGGSGVNREERWDAFLEAAQEGHEQCLRVLLEASPSPSSTAALLDRVYGEDTVLMFAAQGGHVGCVRLLLQHSPETQVTHRAQDGYNALMCASICGESECVALLLQHSPDAQVAAMTDTGKTAAVMAAEHGHLSSLQLLLQHSHQQQRLVKALTKAAQGWAAELQRQQEGGAAAAEVLQPYQHCIELLLSKGAMLTAQAPPGVFALVRPIIQDLAARALVSDMANEAALRAVQEVQAASKGLPRMHPTITPAEVVAVAEQLAVARV